MKKLLLILSLLALPLISQAAYVVPQGGTGSTTLTGILIGNGTSPVRSLTVGSGLSLTGTTLTASGSTGSPYPFNISSPFPNATSTLTWFNGGLGALASSSLQSFTFTNATGTSATTTNFYSDGQTILAGSSGNVGINTLNPQATLQVNGKVGGTIMTLVNSALNTAFTINNSDLKAQFYSSGGVNYASLGFLGTTGLGYTPGNGMLSLITSNLAREVIDSSGNVGIGTTSPGSPLDIGTSSASVGSLRLSGNTTLSGYGGVELANVTGFGLKAASLNYAFNSSNGTTNYMTILSGGNVGIGTTNPGYLLDVNSPIGSGIAVGPSSNPAPTIVGVGITLRDITNADWTIDTGNYGLNFRNASGAIPMTIGNVGSGYVGNVGIGNTLPSAKLTVNTSAVGIGSAISTNFLVNGGALGGTATNEISLGSFGYSAGGNNVALGIRGYRTTTGTDWTGTAIGLGMDVDNTVRAGAALWLHANGSVAVGTPTPSGRFTVQSASGSAVNEFIQNSDFVSGSVGSGVLIATGAASGNTYGEIYAFQNGNTSYGNLVIPNGNVGIGTTNPQSPLHTQGANGSGVGLARFTTSDYVNASVGSGLLIKTGANSGNTYSELDAMSAGFSATNNLILNSTGGNVGIGTTTPLARLDIAGANNGTSPLFQISSVASFATTTRFYVSSGGAVEIGTTTMSNALLNVNGTIMVPNSTGAYRALDNAGNGVSLLGITSANNVGYSGSTVSGSMQFTVPNSTGGFQFFTGSTPANILQITNAGKVGIGIASPNYTLEVNGTASTTNLYATNATTTNATTTSFAISGISSGNCLQTSTGGAIIGSGSACGSGSGGAYPFPLTGNATSTLTQFNGGLTAYASSTISALTVTNGTTTNATTTNFYVSGNTVFAEGGTVPVYFGSSASGGLGLTLWGQDGPPAHSVSLGVSLISGSNKTLSLPNVTDTLAVVGTNNSFSSLQSFTNSNSILAMGSTTLQNFTGVNATTTNATSTNSFAIGSNLVSAFQIGGIGYATSTAWTGSTTAIQLPPPFFAKKIDAISCFTNAGTLNADFYHTSTHLPLIPVTTTVGNVSESATLTAQEKWYVVFGTPASSPTQVTCSIKTEVLGY